VSRKGIRDLSASFVTLGMPFLKVTNSIFRTFYAIAVYRQRSIDFGLTGIGNLPFQAAVAVGN
jgi:hypothetical protein